MKSKTKIYEDANGNASSSRIIALSVIFSSLLFLFSMIIFCFVHPEMALATLGVISGTFTALTAPTFIFMYNQKKTEVSQ